MTKAVQKPVVYLETSFVSYLAGRWSPNDGVRANQAASRAWWELMRDRVQPVVSQVVWKEILDGDATLAVQRAEIIRDFPSWETSPASEALADRLIEAHAIPDPEDDDARHMAVAAVGGADILLTWNCRHINNAMTMSKTVKIIGQAGFVCPVITDPAHLLKTDGVQSMNDPILQEIYDIRRKHWIEAGGTREGLRAYHERFAEEFREKGPDAILRERLEAQAAPRTGRRPSAVRGRKGVTPRRAKTAKKAKGVGA